MVVEVENVVVNRFDEGWWRRGGVEVAESGCSAVRRPVDRRAEADPKRKGERGKGKGKVRDFGAEVVVSSNGASTKYL